MYDRTKYKLEEAKDLILEAKYIIEELVEHSKILSGTDLEYLEATSELILLLSKVKGIGVEDLPVESVYKLLYKDYKQAKEEIKALKKDVENLMKVKEIEPNNKALTLKLLRAERQVESLSNKLETSKERAKRQRRKLRDQIKELKTQLGESYDDEIDEEDDDE